MPPVATLRPPAAGIKPAAALPVRTTAPRRTVPVSAQPAAPPLPTTPPVKASPAARQQPGVPVPTAVAMSVGGGSTPPRTTATNPANVNTSKTPPAARRARKKSIAAGPYVPLRPATPARHEGSVPFQENLGIEGVGVPFFLVMTAVIFAVVICLGIGKLHKVSTDNVFNPDRVARQARVLQDGADIFGLQPVKDEPRP